MAETLKPCPHCGNEGTGPIEDALHVIHVEDASHLAYDRYTVQCDKCTATMGYSDSEDQAVTAWNTRAGGDAEEKGWDHRYRPLIWGEVIQPTDECRRDDGTWVTGICVGEKAPDPSYTSHRIYRRLRLYDVVQEALEFACLTLAFHGRDRGTPRQEKMLDDLEVLARRLDTACRTATKPKPNGAAEWQDRLDWDHEARRDQEIYEQLSGKD